MAVDVSKIPNNNKFDPVREAILDLQGQIEDTGTAIGNGALTINTSGDLTGSGTFTANQAGNTTITIGFDGSGYLTEEANDLTAAVTWANVPDANITQSSVTQHQAALSINESQVTFTSAFIELTDLSVGTPAPASGTGAIAYNNANGVFTYTPPDLSPYMLSSSLDDYLYLPETGNQTMAGGLTVTGNLLGSQVGIGGITPSTNLHVFDNFSIGSITSPNVANASVRIQELTSNMYFDGSSIVITNNSYLTTNGAYEFVLGTNNTPRIYIDAGGNIGINTTSPSAKLHVAGDALFKAPSTGSTTLTIEQGGAIGSARLELNSGTGSSVIDSNSPLNFNAGGSLAMTIDSSQNVGIGTTSPAHKLDVNGSVQITDDNALYLRTSTNGAGATINFSDHASGAYAQNGTLRYIHVDTASYGSGNAFILESTESTMTFLVDGKLMYKEGIYSKPSSGTGAGTRKDLNWDTAYGWGNHADAGYITSFTESDPTVPSHVKSITTTNISNWNTAYGWGNHASAGYLAASSYTASDVLTKIKTVDGSGSGLDADTVDGLQGSSFLRSDTADTATGNLTFNGTVLANQGVYVPYASGQHKPMIVLNGATNYGLFHTEAAQDDFTFDFNGTQVYKFSQSGTATFNGGTVWTSANDGSGSGLDADLLDGQQGTYYDHRRYTDSTNYLGGYYVSGGTEKPNNTIFGAGKLKLAMLSGGNLGFGGSWNDVLWLSSYNGGDVKRSTAIVSSKYDATSLWVAKQNFDSASWGTGYLIWNSGNDGSGSGLDADLLDGQHASAFLTSYTETDTLATVTSRGATTTNAITVGGLTANSGLFKAPSTGPTTLTIEQGGAIGSAILQLNSGTGSSLISSNSPLNFNASGSFAMTIDSSQRVGIGTSTPSAKLHVVGTSLFGGTVTIDTGGNSSDALVIRGDSPTISFIDEGSSDDFYLHTNSNNFYVLRDVAGADSVGTGWDEPHPLQLEGDTNIGYLFGNRIFADNYHPNADTLTTARTINGTSFNGSANITTANWGTARTLTIGNSGKSVNGSANVSWSLSEIGALPAAGGTLTGTLVVANGASIAYADTNGTYVPRPAGAYYKTATNAITGAIKITFSGDLPDDMFSFWVDIFDYAGGTQGESVSLYIYGYAYTNVSPFWANSGAIVLTDRTDRDYTVRFGWDGTNHCVTIGEVTSTWNYAQVNLRDLQAGYTASYTTFDNNIGISFITTLPSVGITSSTNYVAANTARTLQTARTISLTGAVTGSTSFNGSANVSIATTATADPTLTLAGDATGSATFTNLGNATLTVAVVNDSHTHDGRYFTESESDGRFVRKNVGYEWTSIGANALSFRSADTIDTSSGDQASLEVYQDTVGADAFMQFHISGDYAKYFGLHGGINDFVIGGWSHGASYQRIFHDGYHPNADTLTTARTINGTSFNGSANITTANWGTARTIWGQSINGSANITAPLLPSFGSATAPAYSTIGDTNTGIYFPAADTIAITTAGVQRFVVSSTGSVGIGTTSPSSTYSLDIAGDARIIKTDTFGVGANIEFSGSNTVGMVIRNNTGVTKSAIDFYYSSAAQPAKGSIVVSSTSTAYNTTSDYRLKENVTEITDGIDRLKQLKPSRFNFIGDDKVVDGFLAHEAQEIVPEAVTGEKDGVDWEGNPQHQGIDQSKLVPLLTAALQEAVAKIELLEQRILTLENK